MTRRSDIDWDAIEREYRLGQKTNKQLAFEHKVEPSSVGRRAAKYEWVQDKSEEVRTRAENMLLKITAKPLIKAIGKKQTEKATPDALDIKSAATVRVDVVMKHRVGLARLSKVADQMLSELEAQTAQYDMLKAIADAARNPDENGKDATNDLLQKAISLPMRVETLKKLTEVDEKRRKGQREAFNITDGAAAGDGKDALASLLDKIGRVGSAMPVVRDISNLPDDE